MNLLSWIIFGLIVGIFANLIDPTPSRNGIFKAIVLGIFGSVVGGLLGNLLFGVGVTGFNLTSFAIAVAGSLLLLLVARLLSRPREYR